MARQRDNLVLFEAIRVEGALLQPEWLGSIARCGAGGQKDADYDVPEGMNLREEIGRYWRMAKAQWEIATVGPNRNADSSVVAERFVRFLLHKCLGFDSLAQTEPLIEEHGRYPLGFVALGHRVPVVIAPFGRGFDTPTPACGDGTRKRTPFGLAQEYLNAANGALWGIVSDGKRLRILRDNASLTRPAWIEVDLARIFTEDRYAEFAAFWLLAHQSRFGREGQPVAECALETWRAAGREAGTRARERLRDGVERALLALGEGFVRHPENTALRAALGDNSLDATAYFQQLMRLAYRFIFLLTAEERGLLHPPDATVEARKLYAKGYSIGQLRERAVRRNAHDRYSDQWDAVRIVFRGLATGLPALGVPALLGLFAPDQTPHLDAAKIANGPLLDAIFALSWLKDAGGLSRVNWRDMGPEELGSVYEGLLELVPQVSALPRTFGFAGRTESRGNERKQTGSYYTPDSLVQVLLDGALDPVIRETIAANPRRPAEALLDLAIVDPACGSGHFLISAAHRLAEAVARLRADATPTAPERQHALRQVVARCLYGVDLNPMAVELCRVALWMEAVEPGMPLTFLNTHIQHGNALVGVTPGLMGNKVPDAAWSALEGDDRRGARMLRQRNASGERQVTLGFGDPGVNDVATVTRAHAVLDAAPDDTTTGITAKQAQAEAIFASEPHRRAKLLADAWCAAFVWPKPVGEDENGRPTGHPLWEAAPTTDVWLRIRERGTAPTLTVTTTAELAAQYHFFHWHLAFPTVFDRGGFDVVLGNPPWERVKLQELEFFAAHDPAISEAPTAAARKDLIYALRTSDPALAIEWSLALRASSGETKFIRDSGRYPLCGEGDINTYALFAEHNRAILAPRGRAGFIVPTGIATDDTTKRYFGTLVTGNELSRFYSFENEEFVFPSVHHAFKFALVAIDRSGRTESADLFFFARQAANLADESRHFSLTPADFTALNPNTRTCPTFRSRRDADLNLALYRRAGVLWQDDVPGGNPWGLGFMRMFDMATDSEHFQSRASLERLGFRLGGNRFDGPDGGYVPLMEGRMADHFDHRYASVVVEAVRTKLRDASSEFLTDLHKADPGCLPLPRHWIAASAVEARLRGVWERGWLLGWRDITASTNARTVIASVAPLMATGDTLLLALPKADPMSVAALLANLCSFVLDYAARQKVGGTHLKYHTFKQVPALAPAAYTVPASWHPVPPNHEAPTVLGWIVPRVLELTYTSWDLAAFAADVGYDGPPFRWDSGRRFLLRAELDAAFLHLYCVSREDAVFVLESFRVVRARNPGQVDTILAIYDAMATAARTGVPYVTRLDPPPADPRIAHPPRPPATEQA